MNVETPPIKQISFTAYTQFEKFFDIWSEKVSGFDSLSWRSGASEGKIYVDLFPHGNFHYFFSNLLIAKYISVLTGKKIVGLLCNQQLFVRFCFVNDDIVQLARSFGVSDIVNISNAQKDKFSNSSGIYSDRNYRNKADLCSLIEGYESHEFGKRYFGFEDRIRRKFKLPYLKGIALTNRQIDDELELAIAVSNWLKNEGLSSEDYFITGHLEYDPYKLIALRVAEKSGHVVYNWVLQPFTLRTYRDQAAILKNSTFHRTYCFNEMYSELKSRGANFELMNEYYKTSIKKIRPTEVRVAETAKFRRSLADKHVLFMVQSLSDAVHGYGSMLFPDFSEALYESISLLAHRRIKTTIRNHPMQELYDQVDFFSELKREFSGHSCVEFQESKKKLILSDYSMCVTTQGTPGIESALDSVESTINGYSRYSGCGFVNEPGTKDEYFDMLVRPEMLSEEMLRERQERASLYAFLEIFSDRTSSSFLPNGLSANPRVSMQFIIDYADVIMFLSDPLFRKIEGIIEGNTSVECMVKKLMNGRLTQW